MGSFAFQIDPFLSRDGLYSLGRGVLPSCFAILRSFLYPISGNYRIVLARNHPYSPTRNNNSIVADVSRFCCRKVPSASKPGNRMVPQREVVPLQTDRAHICSGNCVALSTGA